MSVQKLHHLKASLKGEDEPQLKNISTTAKDYHLPWEILKERNENVRILITPYICSFLFLVIMSRESGAELLMVTLEICELTSGMIILFISLSTNRMQHHVKTERLASEVRTHP